MNKKQIMTEAFMSHTPNSVTKKDFEACVEAFLQTVTDQLATGEKVSLRGFGTFYTKTLPEREARNPATGETITVGPTTKVKFKPSASII